MDQVSQIRERVDIVSFIGEFITVKKAGRNFKALCPFHGEKSPSFVISPDRQIWHCFGCAKGGDCFTFLMEYEHLEFPEALRTLAQRTGIELSNSKFETETSAKKEKLYELNKIASEFYHYILTKHKAGEKALAYVKKRDVSDKVIESFMIGFAPSTSDALSTYLINKKKYSKEELIDAGLAVERYGRVRDFFWGRLMFPLYDHRDNVVGFSGRILEDVENAPKYINTRETLIYHKGDLFFGLSMTKEAIRKENQAVIVEGEFDVLSCFQNGVGNVVAVKGTALTEKQVNLLSRYAQKVTVCFDGDKAGREAIKRSLPIIEKKGLTMTVIVIPGGKDPDESIKANPSAFKMAVKNDSGIYDYLLIQTLSENDLNSVQGKKKVGEVLLPIFNGIQNEIIKEHYIKKLSQELGTSYEALVKEMGRLEKRVDSSVTEVPQLAKRSREEVLEEYLLSLILQYEKPKVALTQAVEILSESLGKERAYQKILFHMVEYFTAVEEFNSQHFSGVLPSELTSAFDKSLLFPLTSFENSETHLKEITTVARQLRDIYLKERIKLLAQEIKAKETAGDLDAVEKSKEQFSRLTLLLHKSAQ